MTTTVDGSGQSLSERPAVDQTESSATTLSSLLIGSASRCWVQTNLSPPPLQPIRWPLPSTKYPEAAGYSDSARSFVFFEEVTSKNVRVTLQHCRDCFEYLGDLAFLLRSV